MGAHTYTNPWAKYTLYFAIFIYFLCLCFQHSPQIFTILLIIGVVFFSLSFAIEYEMIELPWWLKKTPDTLGFAETRTAAEVERIYREKQHHFTKYGYTDPRIRKEGDWFRTPFTIEYTTDKKGITYERTVPGRTYDERMPEERKQEYMNFVSKTLIYGAGIVILGYSAQITWEVGFYVGQYVRATGADMIILDFLFKTLTYGW